MPLDIRETLTPPPFSSDPVYLIVDRGVLPSIEKKLPELFLNQIGMSQIKGEEEKTLSSYMRLLDEMGALSNIDRKTRVAVIGGGAVLDLGGFVAATFMRGLPLSLFPSTLLGAVDAAIGGKNGVNLPCGKNLVGTFYPPETITFYLPLLDSLPKRELNAGFAEVIKYAVLDHGSFIDDLKTNRLTLKQMIGRCSYLKDSIVTKDPKDQKGIRLKLNLGHTVAHAVEKLTNYRVLHGEAVAIGLTIEAKLSHFLGLCPKALPDLIETLCQKYSLPTSIPESLSPLSLIETMQKDKKNRGAEICFVLPRNPGAVETKIVSRQTLEDFFDRVLSPIG